VGRGRVHRDMVQPWRVLVGDARGHASIDFVDRHAKTAKRQPMAVARQGRRPDIERRRDGVYFLPASIEPDKALRSQTGVYRCPTNTLLAAVYTARPVGVSG
jgi:hypothetical protein